MSFYLNSERVAVKSLFVTSTSVSEYKGMLLEMTPAGGNYSGNQSKHEKHTIILVLIV
ncbi:hypothetical protein HanRHA438_Chr04g0165281 [Helianthus annuus]|uniref:Uncharacterized protein n=1 Tax=Helianthus annuus TaxID=4232 RepID=A0A251UXD7_HELAN|nr:hypothetical protein HanXRQr2_Chr04g0155111 [Helianthus annuus]KAJ0580285.1 hypothetical protein HanHA300_Chr04g0127511 [Helianthus annuus]KAJ0596230.1 hypothetical protein HanHA89_Chr04g0140441 [Helianthus annuus]KAJ0925929.1 hypothetical protein HanRHA438_Chr04g0165281 [Helianthus annuus]KAJ0930419.1 hypothetical protein HanPSC8_Chr04g0149141 [Helianthus annuus]